MREFIKRGNKEFICNFPEENFSPLIEASTILAMKYREKVFSGQESLPLIMSFPQKGAVSIWLASLLLLNFFLEDYIESENKLDVEWQLGDLVDIFGSIAQIVEIDKISSLLHLKFSNLGYKPPLKEIKFLLSSLKKTTRTRLNKYEHFFKVKEAILKDGNVISKLVLPGEKEIINDQVLNSKVLIIAGRGNTNLLREELNRVSIMGEPLSKIFSEGKNLIIKPDLEGFSVTSGSEYAHNFENFRNWFNRLPLEKEFDEFNSSFDSLKKSLEKDLNEFHRNFISFYEEFRDKVPKLEHLHKQYPGPDSESLPEDLRALILNDVTLLEDNQQIIGDLLKRKIPVIILTDKYIPNVTNMNFLANFFKQSSDSIRINWNRKKLNELMSLPKVNCFKTGESHCKIDYKTNKVELLSFEEKEKLIFIDQKLWDNCNRYATQIIKITTFKGGKLDLLFSEIQKAIRDLNEFEILQKSFFQFFYPAVFAIKNSMKIGFRIKEMILEFQKIFNEQKLLGLDKGLTEKIEEIIQTALEHKENSKKFEVNENLFSTLLCHTDDNRTLIPCDSNRINLPTEKTEKILFSGYPFNEFSDRYLLKSACMHFVPYIKLICWPKEGSLTYSYLKNRLIASNFLDNLPDSFDFPQELLLNDQEKVLSEVDSSIKVNNCKSFDFSSEIDNSLEELGLLRYKGYSNQENGRGTFLVKSDIISFEDHSFMFLPREGSILAEVETRDGDLKVKKARFHELSPGNRVFRYIKDRTILREILKQQNEMQDVFEILHLWKSSLGKLLINAQLDLGQLAMNLQKLSDKLEFGNPTITNLQRWLYDDDLLAPNAENRHLILLAAEIEDIDKKLNELNLAYSKAHSFTIKLNSDIKKMIQYKVSNTNIGEKPRFSIEFKAVEIEVESRKISSLINSGEEIDYSHTRKFLC